MKTILKYQKFLPFLYIVAIWIIFSSPYFFQGKVPFPSTYQVNHFKPWSMYEKYWGPVENGAMPDLVDQIYPWKHFTIESWKSGEVPLWNPYNFSGNPHLANFQSAVFTPFNLLFFILPFVDSWTILILLQPLLAGFFTYIFMRELKVGKIAALISSTTFMFCGFITVWMAYGTLSYAIAFLPLALFSVERFYKMKKIIYLILLSISIPLSFFSGHFQTSLYFLFFIAGYVFFKFIQTKNVGLTIYAVAYIMFGCLIAMPQILPSIEFYLYSGRSSTYISGGGIPIQYLITTFAPDFFGNPVTRNDWFGYYAEFASFIGIIPLILSVFALIKLKNDYIKFFLMCAIITLILAINSPILTLISTLKIPVISTSTPSRIIILFSFSIAVLSGFGLEAFQKLLLEKKLKKVFIIFLGGIIVFGLIWTLLFTGNFVPADKFQIALRNLIIPTILFVVFLGVIFVPVLFGKRTIVIIIGLLLLAITFDSLRFAMKWMPADPRDFVFQDLAIISKLKEHAEYGRVYGNLGAQVETYYGISSIEGYDPLYIGRYGDFIMSAGSGKNVPGERSVARLNRTSINTDRVIDMLGVSIIFHPKADTNQGWAYPVWKDDKRFEKVNEDSKFELYKNNSSFSRASLFYSYEHISSPKKIIERFYEKDFDFRNTLIIEEKVDMPSKKTSDKGKVDVKKYHSGNVEIETKTTSPALLFLSDNYYPGWKAYVDGRQTPIMRANYTFRAVNVPKGVHMVQFVYDPLSFKAGLLLGGLGMLGVFAGFKFGVIKKIYA